MKRFEMIVCLTDHTWYSFFMEAVNSDDAIKITAEKLSKNRTDATFIDVMFEEELDSDEE